MFALGHDSGCLALRKSVDLEQQWVTLQSNTRHRSPFSSVEGWVEDWVLTWKPPTSTNHTPISPRYFWGFVWDLIIDLVCRRLSRLGANTIWRFDQRRQRNYCQQRCSGPQANDGWETVPHGVGHTINVVQLWHAYPSTISLHCQYTIRVHEYCGSETEAFAVMIGRE